MKFMNFLKNKPNIKLGSRDLKRKIFSFKNLWKSIFCIHEKFFKAKLSVLINKKTHAIYTIFCNQSGASQIIKHISK